MRQYRDTEIDMRQYRCTFRAIMKHNVYIATNGG